MSRIGGVRTDGETIDGETIDGALCQRTAGDQAASFNMPRSSSGGVPFFHGVATG